MDFLTGFTISFALNLIFSFVVHNIIYRYKTRPIVMPSDQWLDISSLSPETRDFIVTDGSEVETCYSPSYDSKGQIKFGYECVATHWMPLPLPPEIK
jgi:hypothetical protein